MKPISTSLLSFLPLVLWASFASADDADRTALAEALFRQGRELMSTSRFDEACPKLQESQRLDPGGGTLLNLALCHEGQGLLATAWAEFNEAASVARRDNRPDRLDLANQHIHALLPNLSHLTIVVPPSARISGLHISLNGTPLGPAAWGVPIPVNPGPQQILASAPSYAPLQSQVHIAKNGDRQSFTLSPLAPLPSSAPPPPNDTPSHHSSPPTSTYVLGGVGIACLGAGTFFGLRALSKRHESDDECVGGCTQKGVDLNDEAQSAALISNITLGAGVVGVGVAALLWLNSSNESANQSSLHIAPSIGSKRSDVVIQGSF